MTRHTLLAGSYAKPDQPGIYGFAFDTASGALAPLGSCAGIANPSFLALHPNGRWLYAVSENGAGDATPGAVWACRFTAAPWGVVPLGSQPSQGDHPCHLAIDPSGRWLLASNYSSGSVAVLPIQSDGTLGPIAQLAEHSGTGPNAQRQERAHAHSAIFTADGRFVLVADLGIDQLVIYAFDPASGRLTRHGHAPAQPGAGPRHLALHPAGHTLYAANELDNTVAAYSYDAATGLPSQRASIATLPAGAPESYVADIHITADGRLLYVSNRGYDSMAAYHVAPDGGLQLATIAPCGGAWPRNFALAPGERHLLVANQHSGSVAVLPLDGAGAIGVAIAHAAVPGASFVQFIA